MEWTRQRVVVADHYQKHLQNVGDLILPQNAEGASHVYHLYVVRTSKRDALQTFLTENGIGTLIHYPVPPHLQQAYQHFGYKKGDFPLAEELAETTLSLPMYPGLQEHQVIQICNEIKRFFHA